MKMALLILAVTLMVLTGCGRITHSGISKALNDDSLIQVAGARQGVTLMPEGATRESWSSESWSSSSYEAESRRTVRISSGTSGKLIATYRSAIERTITGMGADLHETGFIGETNNIQDFSFGYTWHSNDGIVQVYSFVSTNGEVQVVTFCYEHTH
jgi:hypothetical protein